MTAAHRFILCTSLELCLSLVHPNPQHRLEQSLWDCGVVGLWGCGAVGKAVGMLAMHTPEALQSQPERKRGEGEKEIFDYLSFRLLAAHSISGEWVILS